MIINTERQSKSYAIAAAAAGVSMLALTSPADAKVVITTHINIPVTGIVSLDLNHDGIPDLRFTKESFHFGVVSYLSVKGLHGAGVKGYASALMRSARIGPSAQFHPQAVMAQRSCLYSSSAPPSCDLAGDWGAGQPNRFLGVKFVIKGTTHFGWVRMTVTNTDENPISATITEYGYETVANKTVLAGLPSKNAEEAKAERTSAGPSLAMLARGTEGMALWRREEGNS
jgi:hypothetical protein